MRQLLLALFSLLVLTTAAPAQVILNGDFETGDLSSWTQFGDTDFSGVDSANPNTGTFAGSFGPPTAGGITQDVATVIGQAYEITYFLSVSSFGSPEDNSFQADFGTTNLQTLTNATDSGYVSFTFLATATANLTPLSFTFQNGPGVWNLDDVSISTASVGVPEISSHGAAQPLALMVLMLFLTSTRRRRLAVRAG